MENKFNEQESLQLITDMINQARNNFRKGAGNSMIFLGYTLAVLSILNYVLLVLFNNPFVYSVWALCIPLFFINYFYSSKRYKEALVKSHIDKVIGNVWTSAFISISMIVFICYYAAYGFKSWIPYMLIVPLIMAAGGTALYITAKLCRFKPYAYGGIVFWLGSILCVIISVVMSRIEIQFIIFALSMIAGYVIPGHLANRKAEKDV
ncbi:MAG: hypothetical protein LBL58_04200 [Tannerellaceae bacterium]|jgi:hypothetical protein|nr:hypothetical protein [Tannerellaceae bacterium]